MSVLSRRRDPNARQEAWLIHWGDVHVGTISQCVGNPGAAPKWQWRCGFYPGSRPGECTGGTAETFDKAHAALSKRSEAVFQSWRDQRDWTVRKHALWDTGQRLPLPGAH